MFKVMWRGPALLPWAIGLGECLGVFSLRSITSNVSDEIHAPKAIQWLVLGPGYNGSAAFGQQKDALGLVKGYVRSRLYHDMSIGTDDKLYLQRRVFTRVSQL